MALCLPNAKHTDLVEALFADGVSTAERVSDVSGRGVGMGALRQICVELGGYVRIESEAGIGTLLICAVPSS